MEKKMQHTERRGLPGGPNEMFSYTTGVFSTEGFRMDSPDVNNYQNIIPSGSITMKEKDGSPLRKGPIHGVDNLGNEQVMYPGYDYEFPGTEVTETLMAKMGGALLDKTIECGNCGWKWKAADGGSDVMDCHKCGGKGLMKAQDGDETGEQDNFLKNWFTNRKMPTPEGQKLLEKVRPEAIERASQNVPYVMSNELPKNVAGYYDTEDKNIYLNQAYPTEQIDSTKEHERVHYVQDGDKFYKTLDAPHKYLVEENIKEPKEINTGNPEWDKNVKENYDEIVPQEEIHARIMTLRRLAGFKPDQVITEEMLNNYFNAVEESGESLDPDIEDLKAVTKGNSSIINLLNDMVSTPQKEDTMLYAQKGGEKEDTSWTAYLNPANWGTSRYDDKSTFKEAFRAARNEGDSDFLWKGERYSTELKAEPKAAAKPKGITPELLIRQAYRESAFNPNVVSPAGYKGLGQIGDAVIKDYKKANNITSNIDPFNMKQNSDVQKYSMNELYNSSFINKPGQSEDVRLAKTLASYNWGRGNVMNLLNDLKEEGVDIYNSLDWVSKLPKEPRDYINDILLQKNTTFNTDFSKALGNQKNKPIKRLYGFRDGGESKPGPLMQAYNRLPAEKKMGGAIDYKQVGGEKKYSEQNGKVVVTTKKVDTPNGPRYYQAKSPDYNFSRELVDARSRTMVADSIPKANLDPRILESLNKKQFGGQLNSTNITMYKDYIKGNIGNEELAIKNYDKLNRIYYSKAKELGMTTANYIMTYIVGNS